MASSALDRYSRPPLFEWHLSSAEETGQLSRLGLQPSPSLYISTFHGSWLCLHVTVLWLSGSEAERMCSPQVHSDSLFFRTPEMCPRSMKAAREKHDNMYSGPAGMTSSVNKPAGSTIIIIIHRMPLVTLLLANTMPCRSRVQYSSSHGQENTSRSSPW